MRPSEIGRARTGLSVPRGEVGLVDDEGHGEATGGVLGGAVDGEVVGAGGCVGNFGIFVVVATDDGGGDDQQDGEAENGREAAPERGVRGCEVSCKRQEQQRSE